MIRPRLRFSIREMAIAIAIMAVILALIADYADIYKQFHRIYWTHMVEKHAEEERLCREMAASQPPGSRDKVMWLLGITYHRDLKRRYEEVRDSPWRSVPSDITLSP